MATALSMAAAAFLLTISFGYPLVGVLRRAGLTKQVRAEELPTHFGKTGTPTMGGLMFIGPILVLTLILAITLGVLIKLKKAPEPLIILAAGIVGLALKGLS